MGPDVPGSCVLVTMAMATVSGAGQAALQLCEVLHRRGWRVAVAWGPAGRSDEGVAAAAAMRAVGAELYDIAHPIAPTPSVWRDLNGLARALRPSAVIGIMQRDRVVALALARRLRVPGIVAAQNQHVFWGARPISVAKRHLYAFALKRWATMVVCASEPVRAEVIRFGVTEDRTVVVPNGIPVRDDHGLTDNERSIARRELGAGPEDVLLVNVGRLDTQKGQDILIDAFAICARTRPNVRLALVGGVVGGPNNARMTVFADRLRARAKRSGFADRICFAGWRSDVQRLLAACDGYVHSARWEGLSFAMLEAWSASLPVVITDCSGRPDGFVDGEHGWMVPRQDPSALATAMARLVDAGSRARAEMGRACRELLVRRYDAAQLTSRFATIVEEVVDRTRNRRAAGSAHEGVVE